VLDNSHLTIEQALTVPVMDKSQSRFEPFLTILCRCEYDRRRDGGRHSITGTGRRSAVAREVAGLLQAGNSLRHHLGQSRICDVTDDDGKNGM